MSLLECTNFCGVIDYREIMLMATTCSRESYLVIQAARDTDTVQHYKIQDNNYPSNATNT